MIPGEYKLMGLSPWGLTFHTENCSFGAAGAVVCVMVGCGGAYVAGGWSEKRLVQGE
jgi:hypothetical protein